MYSCCVLSGFGVDASGFGLERYSIILIFAAFSCYDRFIFCFFLWLGFLVGLSFLFIYG